MSRNTDISIGILSLGVALVAFADAAAEVGSVKILAATAGTLALAGGILAIGSGLNKPSCG